VAPGEITFEVENVTGRTGLLTICSIPPGAERTKLQFVPFLTGGRLLVTQSFRELFRSELIRAAEGIGVRDVTVIFTDLKGSTALYERIGDLKAFSLVQQHFERLLQVTVANNGAVIKTIGDAVMAAFEKPSDAVRAAIVMRKEIELFNELHQGQDIVLKIGIHRGPSIAVTLNERLDYFGRTVNIAARVPNRANGYEICFSESVRDAPGVEALVARYIVAGEQMLLKGIDHEVTVFRMGAAMPAEDDRKRSLPAEG
jgi:class 3 adenylate cyclase